MIEIDVDSLSLHVLLLIELNTLTKFQIYVGNLQNKSCLSYLSFNVPVKRKRYQIYW